MRQIILDTETTGLSPQQGHRVIEIGCIELLNRKFTGNHFHVYINPGREVDEGAFRVHGISNHFLQDKPSFEEIFPDFLQFIQGAELIIHNAGFDIGFLNSEFKHVGHSNSIEAYCSIFDTLLFARKKHPGVKNTLDALCKRYHVDNNNRQLHGALLDAELLAYVYLAMTGGQKSLFQENESVTEEASKLNGFQHKPLNSLSPILYANDDELRMHNEFIAEL